MTQEEMKLLGSRNNLELAQLRWNVLKRRYDWAVANLNKTSVNSKEQHGMAQKMYKQTAKELKEHEKAILKLNPIDND